MLGHVIAEAVGTISDHLLEQIGHALGHRGVLRIEVPQAGKLMLRAILAVVVIGDLLVFMEVALVAPAIGDHIEVGGEIVRHHFHDDAHAVLACDIAQFFEIILGAHHVVAD